MIKVKCIINKYEDRFEMELSFDSSESSVEYTQVLAEFLRKKVYEESSTALLYREHTVENDGVLSYTVKMDFRNRKDIADALRTQDVGKLSRYYQEFEKAAKEYMRIKFGGNCNDLKYEIRLIEPQKTPYLRSKQMVAISWAIAVIAVRLVDDFFIRDINPLLIPVIAIGVTVVVEIIESIFSRPGGILK